MMELWTGLVVLIAVTAGVAAMRGWAKHRLLDIPNERSSHSQPTPRGGGLVIAIAVLVGLLAISTKYDDWSLRQTIAFFLAALLVAGVSWLDDLQSLSNRVRIIVHFGAAAIVVAGTGRVLELPAPIPWLIAAGVTLVWIAGLTNAYNFMDGIDGIAGVQAVVAGIAWFVLARDLGSFTASALGLFLAVGSLGFLFHNWPPAKIFMGDVGSAFLGFAFATMPLLVDEPVHPVAAILVVWPFVFDTAFTLLRRLRKGENVFSAHRSHLYQRLVIAGMSHRAVTLLYGMFAVIGATTATIVMPRTGEIVAISAIVPLAAALLAGSVWYQRRRPSSQNVDR